MAETAALLADEVLLERPLRQWHTLVLGVVYRTISRHLLHKAGLARSSGATGAVTLVQRFGSALNLNVHFHMLFLDGVYLVDGTDLPLFRHVAAPGLSELQTLVEEIASRIGRALERCGRCERDIDNAWLAGDGEGGPLHDLLGSSITYRIAVGPRVGQKSFTLQTVPSRLQGLEGDPNGAARAGGFSLHAGSDIAPHQRPKLEHLCRYMSRPLVATERMVMTSSGHVRYALKTPYRDGTTHIVIEPLDAPVADPGRPPTPKHVAMNWARRLKRVFGNQVAPGDDRAGSVPVRTAAWRAGTAAAGQPAMNSKVRGFGRPATGRTGWCMPALRPVPGNGGSRASKPGRAGD
jgi:hypothetical protein